jgi:hypothetical protein
MTGAGGAQCNPPRAVDRLNAALAAISDHALDRAHNTDIAGATAEIAAHSDADRMFVIIQRAQNNVATRHQHARRAIAALQGMLAPERPA